MSFAVKAENQKYAVVAKLFMIYFHESIPSIIKKIKAILESCEKPNLQRFFGKEYTNLKLYHNELVKFTQIWYRSIPDNMDPWEWVFTFVKDAPDYLCSVIEAAPENEKLFLQTRIKLKDNHINAWIDLKNEYKAKLEQMDLPDFNEIFQDKLINTDADFF